MNEIDSILNQLGDAARNEPSPDCEVRLRVMRTVSVQQPVWKMDMAPIVFSAVTVATAAMIVIAFFPSWQTMFDPWASYFAQVSQR